MYYLIIRATASFACDIDSRRVLDATVAICERCSELGGARGRLLPLLKHNLCQQIGDEQFDFLQSREGVTLIAYQELFPRNRAVFQSEFHNRNDFMNAIIHSSMFPFFTSNMPAVVDLSSNYLRICVDGVFTVPMERCGCPDFDAAGVDVVDRTVILSVVPQALTGFDASNKDCISPRWDGPFQLGRLARLALNGSSRKELISLYDSGYKDAERWCREELERARIALLDTFSSSPRMELN